MHVENALEKVNYANLSLGDQGMEIFPSETVLLTLRRNGIIYNVNLIPKDKAPKAY
jgi:hypothetical protein